MGEWRSLFAVAAWALAEEELEREEVVVLLLLLLLLHSLLPKELADEAGGVVVLVLAVELRLLLWLMGDGGQVLLVCSSRDPEGFSGCRKCAGK